MIGIKPFSAHWLAALAIAASGILMGAGSAAQALPNPVQCEIRVTQHSDSTTFQGIVTARIATSGSYSFRLIGSSAAGYSDIDQNGEFSAQPGSRTVVATTSVSGAPGAYKTEFEVTAAGRRLDCSRRSAQ